MTTGSAVTAMVVAGGQAGGGSVTTGGGGGAAGEKGCDTTIKDRVSGAVLGSVAVAFELSLCFAGDFERMNFSAERRVVPFLRSTPAV